MVTDTQIVEKRKQLKEDIQTGKFKYLTLSGIDTIERIIRKVTRNKNNISSWYIFLFISLITPLPGLLLTLLLNEKLSLNILAIGMWGVMLGVLCLVSIKITINKIFDLYCDSIIDNIISLEDLKKLRITLDSCFNQRNQFIVVILISPLVAVFAVFVWYQSKGFFPGYGAIFVVYLISIQCTSGLYGLFVVANKLFSDMKNYRLNLFLPDPSNSKVIIGMSALISNIIYSSSAIGGYATLGLFFFDLINPTSFIIFLAITIWGPIIILFVFGHLNLSEIISKSKGNTILSLQKKIEELQSLKDIPDKKTLDLISSLLDYYDRVKLSRNSAINIKSGMGLLNSMLIPALPLIIPFWEHNIIF